MHPFCYVISKLQVCSVDVEATKEDEKLTTIFHSMEKNKKQGKKGYTKGCVTIIISISSFSNKVRFMLYRNRNIGWSCLISQQ